MRSAMNFQTTFVQLNRKRRPMVYFWRLVADFCVTAALQLGLSWENFAFMQEVMRLTLGISALHSRSASAVQADRCSAVPCAHAGDDEVSTIAAMAPQTADPTRVMTLAFGP
jgi:hypothetical protein